MAILPVPLANLIDDLRQYPGGTVVRTGGRVLAACGAIARGDFVALAAWLDGDRTIEIRHLTQPVQRVMPDVANVDPVELLGAAALALGVIRDASDGDHASAVHAAYLIDSDFVYEHVALATLTASFAMTQRTDSRELVEALLVDLERSTPRHRVGILFAIPPGHLELDTYARTLGWQDTLAGRLSVEWKELHWTIDGWATRHRLHSASRPACTWRDWFLLPLDLHVEVEFAVNVGIRARFVGDSNASSNVWLNNGRANFREITREVPQHLVRG